MIMKEEVEVLCLQETKMSKLDSRVCGELWGDREVEWREVEAVNSAGGVITMWGKGNYEVEEQVLGSNFIGLKGTWKEETETTVIVNVYSPCNMVGKRALWGNYLS